MTENISGIGKGIPASSSTRSSSEQKNTPETAVSPSRNVPSDSSELTTSSLLLQRISDRIADADAVDAGRVEAARAAIDEGRFSVDSERVASRLLEFEKRLETD